MIKNKLEVIWSHAFIVDIFYHVCPFTQVVVVASGQ